MTASAHPPATGSTSPSLLRRLLAGDAEGWEHLVRLYGPLVYRWARCSGLQDSDAADVVQEVFAAVARGIGAFRRDRPGDSFRGWLWGITRNKLRDHFRRQAALPDARGGSEADDRLRQLADAPPDSTADLPAFDAEAALLHRALDIIRTDFDGHTWQAFWRVTIDGQPAADVARDLGMTSRAVRQAKYRVLRRLREEMGDLLGDLP
jgi:RNA polymerase sigma-70 factor (ECF subfamily)